MESLVTQFAEHLIHAGLAKARGHHAPLVAGLDDTLVWNRPAAETRVLAPLFDLLNINSLVFFRPAPPHDRLMGHLARKALDQGAGNAAIHPRDCETRTFLHDLPVVDRFEAQVLARALKQRKSVIILPKDDSFQGPAVLAQGTVSPEQGFVVTSSVCFACFVKFFTDYLEALESGQDDSDMDRTFDAVLPMVKGEIDPLPDLMAGPFNTEEEVYDAIIQAGKATVDLGLVDSYFGNLSLCFNRTLYISQTGSSLDRLAGCIDPVPLDGSTSAGLTASSELTAHLKTLERTGCDTLLHGHPKFSVIMSMICPPEQKQDCPHRDACHIRCPEPREINTTPIVPGEVGTGPTGLCNTLPKAFERSKGVIVYGHGLFTRSQTDFKRAFQRLVAIEAQCKDTYFHRINRLRSKRR